MSKARAWSLKNGDLGWTKSWKTHVNSSKKELPQKTRSFGACFHREAPEPLLPLKVRGLVDLPDLPELPPGPLPGSTRDGREFKETCAD